MMAAFGFLNSLFKPTTATKAASGKTLQKKSRKTRAKPGKKPLRKTTKKIKGKSRRPLKPEPAKRPRPVSLKPSSGRLGQVKPQKPAEKEIGRITHYFSKISVGIIKLKGKLRVGQEVHIKGAHDDFRQVVTSMQLNHQSIAAAGKADEVGIAVTHPVHENDRVYLTAPQSDVSISPLI